MLPLPIVRPPLYRRVNTMKNVSMSDRKDWFRQTRTGTQGQGKGFYNDSRPPECVCGRGTRKDLGAESDFNPVTLRTLSSSLAYSNTPSVWSEGTLYCVESVGLTDVPSFKVCSVGLKCKRYTWFYPRFEVGLRKPHLGPRSPPSSPSSVVDMCARNSEK